MITIFTLPTHRWKEYKDFRLQSLQTDPLAFGKTYEEEVAEPDEKWKTRLARAAKGETILLFAQDGSRIVGMTGAYREEFKKSYHIAHVISTYVDPSYRAKGVAKQLIGALLDRLREWDGIRKVTLRVMTHQPAAIRLYESCGFEKVGRLKGEVKEDDGLYDEWMMEFYFGSDKVSKE